MLCPCQQRSGTEQKPSLRRLLFFACPKRAIRRIMDEGMKRHHYLSSRENLHSWRLISDPSFCLKRWKLDDANPWQHEQHIVRNHLGTLVIPDYRFYNILSWYNPIHNSRWMEFSGLNRLPWSGTGDNTDSRHLEPFWSPIRPTESIKLNDMKAKYDAGFMISTCWPVSCLFPIAKDVASCTTIEINGFCSTDARLGLPKRMPVFPWMTASRFGSPCLCDAARRDSGWGGV